MHTVLITCFLNPYLSFQLGAPIVQWLEHCAAKSPGQDFMIHGMFILVLVLHSRHISGVPSAKLTKGLVRTKPNLFYPKHHPCHKQCQIEFFISLFRI